MKEANDRAIALGVRSIIDVSKASGESLDTLIKWHSSNLNRFDAMCVYARLIITGICGGVK